MIKIGMQPVDIQNRRNYNMYDKSKGHFIVNTQI